MHESATCTEYNSKKKVSGWVSKRFFICPQERTLIESVSIRHHVSTNFIIIYTVGHKKCDFNYIFRKYGPLLNSFIVSHCRRKHNFISNLLKLKLCSVNFAVYNWTAEPNWTLKFYKYSAKHFIPFLTVNLWMQPWKNLSFTL